MYLYLSQLSHEQEEAERLELQRLLNEDSKDNVSFVYQNIFGK